MTAIEFERHIAAPPDIVYGYFTNAEKYTRWMGVDAYIDPRPGGEYRVVNPNGAVTSGRFVALEPPSKIQFTWGFEGNPDVPPGSSTVTVTLTATVRGTALRLTHSGLPNAVWRLTHTSGWDRYLDRLAIVGAGGDPGPLEE